MVVFFRFLWFFFSVAFWLFFSVLSGCYFPLLTQHNYRVFNEHDIKWIQSLNCLKKCGMTIAEMKEYLLLCLQGESSIPQRKQILEIKRKALIASMEELQDSIDFIDWKQGFYDDVLSGKTVYYSNLIPEQYPSEDED